MKILQISWISLALFMICSLGFMIGHQAHARSVRLLPLTIKRSTDLIDNTQHKIKPNDQIFLSQTIAQMLMKHSNKLIEVITAEELNQSLSEDFDPTTCGQNCSQLIAKIAQADIVLSGELLQFGQSWRLVISIKDMGADQEIITETLKSTAQYGTQIIEQFEHQLQALTKVWVNTLSDRLNEISDRPIQLYKVEQAIISQTGRWSELGITWIPIEGAQYEMGNVKGHPNERPIHAVRVNRFQMMKTEVTASQYWACVQSSTCTAIPDRNGCVRLGPNSREAVNCVTWRQATIFAQWIGARLPNEAEWELAAKGKMGRSYPWGEEAPTCEHLSYTDSQGREGCGEPESQAPCGYPRGLTPEGVCDLAGNLWEWVKDDWHRTYQRAPHKGSWCGVKGCSPSSRTYKTYRGGSWYHSARKARSTARAGALHTTISEGIGFRCVL